MGGPDSWRNSAVEAFFTDSCWLPSSNLAEHAFNILAVGDSNGDFQSSGSSVRRFSRWPLSTRRASIREYSRPCSRTETLTPA